MPRSDERGVAVVMALLMVLLVSSLGSAMIFVARGETLSSLSYTAMSQVRYGAESGLHAAANHLLFSYTPPGTAADPLATYDLTRSPVTFNNAPVVLSSDPDVPSHYPVADVVTAFMAQSQGTLDVSGADVQYVASATLVSMRSITDSYSGLPVTIQTWEVTGRARAAGAGAALVEVSATIERQPVPIYQYAAFAKHNGCSALSFAGGAETKSYDSGALVGGNPVISNTGGNVGTNGNLDGNGDPTTINGTLSTPRAGVGTCTTNNVTAATIKGWATVEEGLVALPQPVDLPNPAPLDPPPPTTSTSFGNSGCPATISPASTCSESGGEFSIQPSPAGSVVSMGNVNVSSGKELHLNAGVYEVNSLKLNGNARIVVDSGPVIVKIAGKNETTPLDLSGGGVSNPSFDPSRLQFVYGGSGDIKITGGTDSAALVYAPNASAAMSGGSDFYGAIVTNKITATGGFKLYYDRRLSNTVMTSGNPTMSAFTWRTF